MCGLIFPSPGRSRAGDPKNESTGSKMVRIMSYKVLEGEDLMVEEPFVGCKSLWNRLR